MSTVTGSATTTVPKAIRGKLRRLVGRARRIVLLRGLLAAVAAIVGVLLLAIGVDALLSPDTPALRWALSLVALAAAVAAVAWFVVRPLRRRLSMVAMARMVEEHHPELQERISSTVELLQASDGRGSRGSQRLIAALAAEATIDAGRVDPRREVSSRSVAPYAVVAAVLLLIFGGLLAVWPQHVLLLLRRTLIPHADLHNLQAMQLIVEPGDAVVPLGKPLTISVRAADATLPETHLEWIDQQQFPGAVAMQPVAGDTTASACSHTFDSVTGSFRYRVRAGRALTEYYDITAVPLPEIEQLEVQLEYPAYTQRPVETLVDPTETIEALVGTRVTVVARAGKPVWGGALTAGERKLEGQSVDDRPQQWTWTMQVEPEMDALCRVVLRDEHDFASQEREFSLRATNDLPPRVRIIQPEQRQLRLHRRDRLPIHYLALDDFGIGRVSALVTADGAHRLEGQQAPLPKPDEQVAGIYRGVAMLELARYDLRQHRKLEVRLEVADTLPDDRDGPQLAESETIVIELIDSQQESFRRQQILQQQKQLAEEMRQAHQAIQEAVRQARPTSDQLQRENAEEEEVAEQLDAFEQQTQEAADRMQELAERWDETLFDAVADQLEQIAQQQTEPAREQAQLAQLTDERQQQAEHVQQARENLEAAAEQLREAAQQSREQSQQAQRVEQLEQLAQQQQRLADQATELAADNEQVDQPWQADQQRTAQQVAQQVRRDEASQAAQAQSDQQMAQQLAEAAEQLAEQQQQARDDAQQLGDSDANQDALRQEVLDQLAEQQQAIAEQTGQLAQQQAGQLAGQQENVAEALAALQQNDLGQAMAELQENVAAQAQQLQQQAEQLADRRQLAAPGPSPQAQQAASQLGQATEQAEQAAGQLQQSQQQSAAGQTDAASQQMAAAGQSQQRSAQSLAQAAESLGALAEQLGQQASQLEPAEPNTAAAEAAGQLSEALGQTSEASQAESQPTAAQSAQAAAESLAQAAEAAARAAQMPSPSELAMPNAAMQPSQMFGGQQPNEETDAPRQPVDDQLDPRPLSTVSSDWARFHGKAEGQLAEGAAADLPPQYRELVRRYFQVLAQQAGRNDSE